APSPRRFALLVAFGRAAKLGRGVTELERKQDRAPIPSDWTYAPAPESREIVEVRDRYGFFIGGEWVEPKETYTTTEAEVQAAVGAAREAFSNGWSSLAGSERAKYLFRIARLLQERSREFAVLE